jgi:ubiquinone/menaquinone biosynthesis C-methylase UbiE
LSGCSPQDIVRRGYDAIADRFAEWQRGIVGDERERWVRELLPRLPPDANVLELGCGAAVESTALLADRGRLTGVDISPEQLRRARERLRDAVFVEGDITKVDFPAESFDAVVSLFVLQHIPHEELAPLLASVARWLRRGGHFLATMGVRGRGEFVEDWLGVPMFFSSITADASRRLLRDAGLELVHDEIVTQDEPGHGARSFLWVLARRP